mgnify:CR=1 FL=1
MSTTIAVGATVAMLGIAWEIVKTIKTAVKRSGRYDDRN